MKIKASKKDLLSLLGKTQNIVEKRNTMPILTNILLEAKDNVLNVFATDLEVSLTDQIDVEVVEPGKVAAGAKSLFEIIKELDDGEVSLNKKENNWLEIKQNKSLFNIVGISAEEYPVFPTHSGKNYIQIPPKKLKDMIEKTIYSVSNDETRYHLNGVYLEKIENDNFRMVATDGHRLSLIEHGMKIQFPSNFENGVIIPKKGLQEIHKIIDAIDEEHFEMAIEGSQLIVRNKSTFLMIRLIEGRYPNYKQLIPQNMDHLVTIDRQVFLSSLKRVSLLSNQKSKGVTLNLSPGRLEISSNNPELGDAKEELEIEYTGKNFKIGFNARYILDVLNSIQESDIEIQLKDQLSPGLMRPSNDKNYTCVVMPMRI